MKCGRFKFVAIDIFACRSLKNLQAGRAVAIDVTVQRGSFDLEAVMATYLMVTAL
jgi:hypothetical protein